MTYWRTDLPVIIQFSVLNGLNIHNFCRHRSYTVDSLLFCKYILHSAIPIQVCESQEERILQHRVYVLFDSHTGSIKTRIFSCIQNSDKALNVHNIHLKRLSHYIAASSNHTFILSILVSTCILRQIKCRSNQFLSLLHRQMPLCEKSLFSSVLDWTSH